MSKSKENKNFKSSAYAYLDKNSADHYINGRFVKGEGPSFQSLDPATGLKICEGQAASLQEINAAYAAAEAALPSFADLALQERAQYLENFAQAVQAASSKLSALISLETGKPLWEAKTEVQSVIQKVAISIEAYKERCKEKEIALSDSKGLLRFKPQGIVAILGPFNFPAHLSNGHIVPALLAGNTVLYKPSEECPAVAHAIMQCWDQAGLPPGVLNCLQGGRDSGQALLSCKVQGVYFTGSYATGLEILKQFHTRPEVIVALELGGNNPLVFGTVLAQNIEAAVFHTLLSSFITAGQRCSCARRLFIPQTRQGDRFLAELLQATEKIKVGSFKEQPEPFMGPVINASAARNHLKKQEALIGLGGRSLLPLRLGQDNTGFLYPGLIDMTGITAADEEIFAPLLQIYRYENFQAALVCANQTRYGLVAGLLSDKAEEYQAFYKTIRAGLINWNRPTTGASSALPFGGIGISGNHRPSAYFAADYSAYPIASLEAEQVLMPSLPPGLK